MVKGKPSIVPIGWPRPRATGFVPSVCIDRWRMETVLPEEFSAFLSLLNQSDVEYLLIGGFAVGYHGYPRTTADLDVWVAISSRNANNILRALHQFGMRDPSLTPELLQEVGKVVRMGVPPMRIELLTDIDGVTFEEAYADRVLAEIDGLPIPMISLPLLRRNKLASGRYKDLDDLEHLPEHTS